MFGNTTLTVRAVDDGGTASGGNDTSRTYHVPFAILPVNDVPTFDVIAGEVTVLEDAGASRLKPLILSPKP